MGRSMQVYDTGDITIWSATVQSELPMCMVRGRWAGDGVDGTFEAVRTAQADVVDASRLAATVSQTNAAVTSWVADYKHTVLKYMV